MAKFCTKCGSPLEDGKKCKCESEKVVVKSKTSSNFTDLLKKYVDLVKESFKKPVDVVKENATEDNFNLSLISIGITSISMGLFICLIIKNMFGGFSGMVEIPYIKVFLVGFITMAAMISILAVATYLLVEKAFKANTSIKKMFVLFGLSSIILVIAFLVASVLALVDINIMVPYAVIAIGGILWFAYNIKGIEYYSKLNINYVGYVMAISYAVTSVAIYFLLENVIVKILM